LLLLGAAAPPSPYVQIDQLEQSRSLGGDRLGAFLNGHDRLVAIRAALAIGRTKQRAGIPLLRAHLRDRDTGLRAMSVYALGLIGSPYVQSDVLAALLDRSDAVRLAAYDAAGRLEAAKAFSRVNEMAAARVLATDLTRQPSPVVRSRAATAIEAFKDGGARNEGARALAAAFARERDATVRWHIMWSIYRGYPVAVPRTLLVGALRDRNELVRVEAVRALGRVKNPDAVASLQPMLHDSSWRVQEQAVESIKALRKEPATDHLKAIADGVRIPAVQTDPLANLPALPRTPDTMSPAAPQPQEAIERPKLDPSTVAAFAGPAAGPHPRLRIVTTKGNVYVELYPEWAPLTVENFLNLANRGYYDDNPWFRIVPDFVVQTGGGTDGNSDVKYSIGAEENPIEQDAYVISMGLNYTDPPDAHAIRDSAGSEFYITLSPQLHLDRDFTVFGRVIGGTGVLGRLIESDKIVRIERIADTSQ
jgi:peptidyl-prolyl cis-trans isomerase B (cyclophilin B)